jgi:hypothetical protein
MERNSGNSLHAQLPALKAEIRKNHPSAAKAALIAGVSWHD